MTVAERALGLMRFITVSPVPATLLGVYHRPMHKPGDRSDAGQLMTQVATLDSETIDALYRSCARL